MSADGSQTLPFEWQEDEPRPRRKRRLWPWLVVFAIVVALVVAAWFAAEAIARGVVETGVRTLVASQVQLPPGGEVDVEMEGAVLPQLISGTIDEITVSADDVAVGPITGDISVTALGVPIRADAAATGGTATVRLDQEQLRVLLSEIENFPAGTVGLAAPHATMSTELSVFGAAIPVGVALTPGAANGELVLTPASFQAGGVELTADALRSQFGGVADAVLRDWSLCIADDLPAALTLTGATVDASNELVATFDVNGSVIVDTSLLQNGTCA